MHLGILDCFERLLIFEVSGPLFRIRGQRLTQFALDLSNAPRQLRKACMECFCNVLVHV